MRRGNVHNSTAFPMSSVAPPLTDLYAPIREDLIVAQRIFEEELTSELDFVNRLCERVRSYRGKMLRPALLLLCGRAAGGVNKTHHTLAAVVEIVHMSTLVHDDVLDEADERRRQPTICSTDGNVAAVLLGDYLISHAYRLCSQVESAMAGLRIGDTTNTVCEGELLQNHLRYNDRLTESDYFEIIRRKTGALTAVSCELGAHYAGADAAVTAAMYAYGLSAGIAFQIIDDVLDLVGDQREVGKTLHRDLALGKLTLPTIHCLTHAAPDTARQLHDVVHGKAPWESGLIRAWLAETESVEYAESVASRCVGDALRQLELLPESDARTSLTTMAEFIVQRRF